MYKEPVMAQLRYYPGHLTEEKSWQFPLGLLVSTVLNSGPYKSFMAGPSGIHTLTSYVHPELLLLQPNLSTQNT
jgi:hypothetical protein